MERISVFKVFKGLAKSFLVLGTILTILSLSLVIKSLINGFDTKFPSGDWNFVTFFVQGILFIIMGYANLKNRKYYIEWDDKELRFLLPDTKRVESVLFSEITSVNVKLFEIELNLADSVRTFNLDSLEFEDLKKVKKKFEEFNQINR